MLLSDDDALSDMGIIIGLVGTAIHFVGQFVILYILKRNTEKYCGMSVLEQSVEN
jgi:hypothetical protein